MNKDAEEPTPVTATSLALDVAALAAADRTSALSRETDWSGLWFDLIEKESGDYVGMRAAHVPASGKKAVWHFLTHSSRDGIGALVELMRRGNPDADIPMPRLKGTSQPPRLTQVGALLRLMAVWPRCARWRTHDRAWTPPAGVPRPGTAVAARTLDAEQTRRVEERARTERVSFNSLLLAALGRATQSELGEGPAYWMMPVNMRGPVAKADESANHTAYLRVNVARDATPAGVQATIKRCFANNEHWGSWLFLHIGRVVGHTGMKLIYRTELARWRGCLWAGASRTSAPGTAAASGSSPLPSPSRARSPRGLSSATAISASPSTRTPRSPRTPSGRTRSWTAGSLSWLASQPDPSAPRAFTTTGATGTMRGSANDRVSWPLRAPSSGKAKATRSIRRRSCRRARR